jgi:alcohol dehydrogenase class IV
MDLAKLFEFQSPARIVFGANAVDKLGEEIAGLNGKKVLVVTDEGVVNAGLLDKITGKLKDASIDYAVYDKVEANPRLANIHEGADLFKEENCDLIIGLGGGSPMDAAKAIGVKATHEGDVADYTRRGGKPVQDILPPLIAIPTTSGTASEVTWFSVLTDPDEKTKIVIATPCIAADVSLVDPVMTLTMPPQVTAFTGMDALTHAVEAYVSIKATPISDTLAFKAIELIGSNLREAVGNGDNLEARSNMMMGSTIAGVAFANSSVGLVHAVAHALGGQFNIAHGIANAFMLPLVMNYNLIACPSKYADIALALGEDVEGLNDMEAARIAVEAVMDLSEDIGIPKDLKKLGADPSLIDALADESASQGGSYPNNPRKVRKADVVAMFKEAFEE